MSEKPSIERITPTVEITDIASEQAEKLRKNESSAESNPEKNSSEQLKEARHETEEIFAKEASKEARSGGEPTISESTIRHITTREKQRAYKQTLSRAQSEMSTPARAFSKVIHAPVVEKASEVAGSTIARPNALLFGSVIALLSLSVLYGLGKTYGYQLSGFEMIGAYALGWIVGLIIDYVRVLVTGRS